MRRRHHDEPLPADLAEVAEQLRSERPQADPLELDRIRVRARSRAGRAARTSRQKGTFMTSRIAVTVILALGVFMSGAGATLAITNFDGSAAQVQYGGGGGDVEGVEERRGAPRGGQVAGVQEEAAPSEAQAGRQAAGVGQGDLPFTGFAAIPVLLGGIALLGAGFVLRRRAARE